MAEPTLNEAQKVFKDQQLAALANASCRGDVDAIQLLLRKDVPVDGTGHRSTTPLAWAVGCRDLDGVRALLEAGANPNHLIDEKYTVFWAAAGHDNVDILQSMLDHGADINFMAPDEDTVLMHTVLLGAWKSFQFLVDAGADLNKAGPVSGSTVATSCLTSFRFDLVVELIEKGYRYDLVDLAVYAENLPVNENARPARDHLLSVLKAHGVEWPLPARLTDEARVSYMAEHPKYAREHPESAPRRVK